MFKSIFSNPVFRDIIGLGLLAVPLIVDAEEKLGGGNGEQKRLKVVADIMNLIKQPGGLEFPEWLNNPMEKIILPWLISLLVSFLNSKQGKN